MSKILREFNISNAMPFLPKEILKSVEDSTEKIKEGEEGILHRIKLNKKDYFAKHWRGKHYEGEAWKTGRKYSSETAWRTPVSPFWSKIKFYETQLMHDALPDLVLPIEAGFDPRVSSDGSIFNIRAGRPVTLAKDVKGDSKLRKERDELVDAIYKRTFQEFHTNKYGNWVPRGNFYPTLVQWAELDIDIQKRFGEYLDVRKHIHANTFNTRASVEVFVERILQKYQGTDVERMVQAGVVPIHAEVNYIPTEQVAGKQKTKGIFIETFIFDMNRLVEAILMQSKKEISSGTFNGNETRKRIQEKIERYTLLRKLDELWDEVFYLGETEHHKDIHTDSEVMGGVFRVLDFIRVRWDKEKITLNEDFFYHVKSMLISVRFSKTKEKAITYTRELHNFIREWKAESKQVA